MKTLKNSAGFTLVEILSVTMITALVILASSQATLFFMKSMFRVEKRSEASGEMQDLMMYLRRSSKNISESRVDRPTTYILSANSNPVSLGANNVEKPPMRSFVVNTQQWLSGGQGHPLYTRASALSSQSEIPIFINSFNVEEHGLRNDGGKLVKYTRRMMVTRCEKLDQIFSLKDSAANRTVPALYVLAGMSRVPFISYDSNGNSSVRCCPMNQPNCSDGSMYSHFFRTYAISFNDAGTVVNVEEFPKPTPGNPVFGGGFGLYYSNATGSNVQIATFTLVNRCKTTDNFQSPACKEVELPAFLQQLATNPSALKMDLRFISTSVSEAIADTGVISL